MLAVRVMGQGHPTLFPVTACRRPSIAPFADRRRTAALSVSRSMGRTTFSTTHPTPPMHRTLPLATRARRRQPGAVPNPLIKP
jgi:hypothetical protein